VALPQKDLHGKSFYVVLEFVAMITKTIRELVNQLFSLILPFVVLVLIPYLILSVLETSSAKSQSLWSYVLLIAGPALIVAGLLGIAWAVSLFIRIGRGTLAPWNPTHRLVVAGPYAYVRNPMIASVIIVLLGEALFFESPGILAWAIFVFILNHFYFIFSEEPGLARRFGEEYEVYKRNVPRWLPRMRPWKPPA
jgi:protein-S-isoprenylcysteine O-methyltransferase Ste14